MNKNIKKTEKVQLIQILGLLHVYKGNVETVALPGINITINKGEKVVVRGKSGVGKSTLLHCLGGLVRPTSGKIIVENRNIVDFNDDQLAEYRCKTVGIIYQSFNLAPYLTIKENIEFPMVLAKQNSEYIEKRTHELVEKLEIERYLDQKPTYLSGGEQQRAAIAVALGNNPPIILADEPTGNLDVNTAEIVYDLLTKTCEYYRTTLVLASHDPIASNYANREIDLPKLQTIEL